jgi:hypothetical protein
MNTETNPLNRRPVPHIQHTADLEAAAIAVDNAIGPNGLPIRLCQNTLDVERVRYALGTTAEGLKDPSFTYESEAASELIALDHLILLATLLREHLRAGNT